MLDHYTEAGSLHQKSTMNRNRMPWLYFSKVYMSEKARKKDSKQLIEIRLDFILF